MRQSHLLIVSALLICSLTACDKQASSTSDPSSTTTKMPGPAVETTVPPVTSPVVSDPALEAAVAPDAGFRIENIPLSTATLPPFPFFKFPDGLVGKIKDDKSTVDFARHFFLAGKKMIAVEGRLYHNDMSLIAPNKSREYSTTEFHRNYENAILALGGVKISETQFTRAIVDEAGGLREVNKYWRSAPPTSGYEHYSYLIRTAGNEYWVHVGTSAAKPSGHIVVLEKETMAQSLGFLDAGAMKKALDADGRVALYINFDTDKATLRTDGHAVIDEIKKLLDADPSLALSIEGHTDNTGSADHNRRLSDDRARSVLDTLVALGIAPSRLSSKGFGPDKPVADNADEAGRAKNRRVELVKR